MQIYNYSKVTGEYMGESSARLDPVDGTPMIPAFATELPPPAAGAYQVVVFGDGVWSLHEDHRDRGAWLTSDASQTAIELIGTIPDGTTLISPEAMAYPVWFEVTWVEDLELHKESKIDEIKLAYHDAEANSTITVGSDTYRADYNYLNGVDLERRLAGANGETTMIVFDVDLNPHEVALTAVDSVMQDMRINTKANYTKAKDLTRQVNQATTVEEVSDISWNS